MKKYLVISSDTFIWRKGTKGIIYNCNNFAKYSFNVNKDISKLCNPINLYSAPINDKSLYYRNVKTFIDHIIQMNAGKIIHNLEDCISDISYVPILRVYNDYKTILWEKQNGRTNKILNNLCELTFHINGNMECNNDYYKQTIYPHHFKEELSLTLLEDFIQRCQNTNLSIINIVGNIYEHSQKENIIKYLVSVKYNVNIYITKYDELQYLISQLKPIDNHITIYFLCNTIDTFHTINIELDKLNNLVTFKIIALITSKDNLTTFSKVTDNILPVYTGDNLDFFEKNIYTTAEDIESFKICKRIIFANQTINSNFWGKLIILPNKRVYSNVNFKHLGKIQEPVNALLYKEFKNKGAWFSIRNNKTCNNCVFQWLCPPPSNYEFSIGKYNLCTIR